MLDPSFTSGCCKASLNLSFRACRSASTSKPNYSTSCVDYRVFFVTQKVTLHCAFSFLATALSLAVLPSRKHLPCDCWRFAALDPHILIAACLRACRGAVCLGGVHICAPKPLRQRPWPQDLGGFHNDPHDAVYSFSEVRIRRQRSGDGVRAKRKALEGAGQCWICGHQKMNDIIHDIHSLQIARKHVHLVLILFPIHLRPLLPPNFTHLTYRQHA